VRKAFTALLYVSVAAAAFLAFAWPFTISRDQDSAAYHVIAVGVLLRLIIWVLVVLVTIAVLAPLGFRPDG
jgi:hypothetical protein